MLRFRLTALVLALSGCGAAEEGERYTLRLKEAAPGDVASVTQTFSGENRTKLRDVEKVQKMTTAATFRETVLDKKNKEPATRLKRQYRKARMTKDDQPQALPYDGKTVLIEKEDGKYQFSLEGGARVTGDDARWLDREFNQGLDNGPSLGKALLPGKPVRTGDEWQLDRERLVKRLLPDANAGLGLDFAKGKGSTKLVRVYTKEGARFGVLSFHVEVPITQIRQGGFKFDAAAGSRFSADGTLDLCIDGRRTDGTTKVTVEVKMIVKVPTGGVVNGNARYVTEETRTEPPRK